MIKAKKRMYETVENILRVTTFIAVGGTVAVVFFFIFAQTIMGLKTLHKQLERLIEQNKKILDLLREIQKENNIPGKSDKKQ